MDIFHTKGHKPALEVHDPVKQWTGFMNMQKFQQRDELIEKLLTDQTRQAKYARGIDSLIQGLVDLLPKRDEMWPLQERAKWLRLAVGIFDLGYKAGDGKHAEISIVLVKPESAGPRRG